MRYVAILVLMLVGGCGSPTAPPELSESAQTDPKTGAITLVICWDGVCPEPDSVVTVPDTLGGRW